MELIVVLVIALVVIGPKRLPDAGRSIGRGIREFKGAVSGEHDDRDESDVLPAPVDASESSRARAAHPVA
jgi:sec-independent protein translocase protein TatA